MIASTPNRSLAVGATLIMLAGVLAAGPARAAGPCIDGPNSPCADKSFDPQPGLGDAAPGMVGGSPPLILKRAPAGSPSPPARAFAPKKKPLESYEAAPPPAPIEPAPETDEDDNTED